MKKSKRVAWILIAVILPLVMLSCKDTGTADREELEADILENVSRMEEVMQKEDPDFKALGYTEVTQVSYAQTNGHDIQYYYCGTTYFDEVPELTGVHLDAIKGVVDPALAESSRDTKVLDYDAIIYALDGREYLCWSISPEDSCVLEYTPGTVSEADLLMMAESVQ